jgi:hypothetical protein
VGVGVLLAGLASAGDPVPLEYWGGDAGGHWCTTYGYAFNLGVVCAAIPPGSAAAQVVLQDNAPWAVGATWHVHTPTGVAPGGLICGQDAFGVPADGVELVVFLIGPRPPNPCGLPSGPATHGLVRIAFS